MAQVIEHYFTFRSYLCLAQDEVTHNFCMAFSKSANKFGLSLMQRPITVTSKSDL